MADLDFDALLNKTSFCTDVMALLSDVDSFLELSEENIERQKAHELQLAANTEILEDDERLQHQFQAHLIDCANYHFDVSLTQRVRYAGLTALITTVDWCALGFQKRLTFDLPKKRKAINPTVHLLTVVNDRARLPYAAEIEDLAGLVQVRNCVVHAAGLVESYEYKESLEQAMAKLEGVALSSENFLGKSIAIDRNALSSRIEAMKRWLTDIDEQCTKQGLLAK